MCRRVLCRHGKGKPLNDEKPYQYFFIQSLICIFSSGSDDGSPNEVINKKLKLLYHHLLIFRLYIYIYIHTYIRTHGHLGSLTKEDVKKCIVIIHRVCGEFGQKH
ncbi:Hypothetical predicted protein [Octopus vulgaris]|uniref:Uncharacterized protein n=1 Tax=Octopus vulgaris TaxID=6645 RepID=A0AA36AKP4_OCTVU|nr:Hypothetical predicted protein [Octopus vulgaris]